MLRHISEDDVPDGTHLRGLCSVVHATVFGKVAKDGSMCIKSRSYNRKKERKKESHHRVMKRHDLAVGSAGPGSQPTMACPDSSPGRVLVVTPQKVSRLEVLGPGEGSTARREAI